MLQNDEDKGMSNENYQSEVGKVKKWISKNKWKVVGGVALAGISAGVVCLLYRNSSFYEYGIGSVLKGLKRMGHESTGIAERINMTETVFTETTKTVISAVEDSTIVENSVAKKEIQVDGFVRNLPKNWNPSAEKLTEALEKGIDLKPHQTIVDSYTKIL